MKNKTDSRRNPLREALLTESGARRSFENRDFLTSRPRCQKDRRKIQRPSGLKVVLNKNKTGAPDSNKLF